MLGRKCKLSQKESFADTLTHAETVMDFSKRSKHLLSASFGETTTCKGARGLARRGSGKKRKGTGE